MKLPSAPLYAHSRSGRPTTEWEPLADHLRQVADRAHSFALDMSLASLSPSQATFAGLLHDVGKARGAFQRRLQGSPIAAAHAPYGAAAAMRAGDPLVALAVLGHHAGLCDVGELRGTVREADAEDIDALVRAAIGELPCATSPNPATDPLEIDLMARMLYSCLVDADFLETEAFMAQGEPVPRATPSLNAGVLLDAVVAHTMALKADTLIGKIRSEVLDACIAAGGLQQGSFSLTVPTGGGKTLSSMAFALAHAKAHSLRRIIYVIPYISIIEQNAAVFQRVLGHDQVLAHHSLADMADRADEELSGWSPALAAQNWDAPIIVTTAVQFLESLFSNRSSRCRKLHNIPGSVIIFDECQTLDPSKLTPILDMLKRLQAQAGVSVVMCTATQPALGQDAGMPDGLPNMREIAPEPARLFTELRRTQYHWPSPDGSPMPWPEVAERMASAHKTQALCIVNTKQQAFDLYSALCGCESMPSDGAVLHLSTSMCPAHRLEVIGQVRKALLDSAPCLLVSTQIVEAGVDLDFPMVMRALGPLDSIAQAAGRCNREGRLCVGDVHVFRPEGEAVPPGWYKMATETTANMLKGPEPDMYDPETYRHYFGALYGYGDLDSAKIQEKRRELRFRSVAEAFKIIADDTVSVVVRYVPPGATESPATALIAELCHIGRPRRETMRKLAPYMVAVRQRAFDQALRDRSIIELVPGVYEWAVEYDARTGITLSPDAFIA